MEEKTPTLLKTMIHCRNLRRNRLIEQISTRRRIEIRCTNIRNRPKIRDHGQILNIQRLFIMR